MNLAALTETGPRCVHFAPVAEIAAFLEHPCTLAVFHLRGVDLQTQDDLWTYLARAMEFPEWFGRNADALGNCLRDLAWHPAPGYVLIVWDAERGTPDVLKVLRHCWEFCAPYWLEPDGADEFGPAHPTPFHLVFVGQEEHVFPRPKGSA